MRKMTLVEEHLGQRLVDRIKSGYVAPWAAIQVTSEIKSMMDISKESPSFVRQVSFFPIIPSIVNEFVACSMTFKSAVREGHFDWFFHRFFEKTSFMFKNQRIFSFIIPFEDGFLICDRAAITSTVDFRLPNTLGLYLNVPVIGLSYSQDLSCLTANSVFCKLQNERNFLTFEPEDISSFIAGEHSKYFDSSLIQDKYIVKNKVIS